MTDQEPTTAAEHATKPVDRAPMKAGFSLPGLLGRLGLYATYVTAALLLLVLAADASVALVGPAPSVWLALLLDTGPRVALLLSTFASYVNYYGTWRILRRSDAYDAGQDLKSHAADLPEALQGMLAGRHGCVALVASLSLVLSLGLTAVTIVPPSLPYVNAISIYTQQLDNLALANAQATPPPAPTATAAPVPTPLPSPTPTALPSPTPTACPTLQAQITAPKNGATYYSNQAISFTGTVTGTCGTIPTSDLTWSAVDTSTGASTPLGNGDAVSAALPPGTYTIVFQVTDPTSGQSSSSSIALTVLQYIG